jgi:hypothetical protein
VTAKILKPTPSLEKIRAEKAAVDREIDLKLSRLTMASGELDYGRKIELEKAELDRERERRKKRWQQYYEERRRRQMMLAATLGRLSPSVSWTYAAVALTGTGGDAFEALRRGRKRMGEEFGKRWEDALAKRRSGGGWPELTAADVPSLRVEFPDDTAAFRAALNDVLILVILNVIFFMLGFTFFLRYDVR